MSTRVARWLRWDHGRQGTGYDKMLLATGRWPLGFDCYLLRYPTGSAIPPHTDPVSDKRHYRLNIVVKQARSGGEFICKNPIFQTRRIKLFRPDISEHAVEAVTQGSRYVLSLGWVLPHHRPTP
jgi:hypothetical protein